MNGRLRNTLHINKYNIAGVILLLPFIILFGIDFLGRLVQGDFTHYNKAFYNVVSHTILYNNYNGQAPLLWTILVYSPILAAVLNLIPFIASLKQNKKKITASALFFISPLALIIMSIGLFCLLIVFGHDVIPCFVHGIISHGLGNIMPTIEVCKKA